MRAILLILCLLAALPARARDCGPEMPRGLASHAGLWRDVIDCLVDEVATLRRAQARLAARLDESEAALAAALAATPVDYVNRDGKAEAPAGRPVGRARFVLSARTTGGASALALERSVVEALCADEAGCNLRLARREAGLNAAPPSGTGPCLFLLDPDSGGWFRGAGCGGTEARGADGNGGPFGGGGEIIAEAGHTCLLADAEARRGPGPDTGLLDSDAAAGLFLIAAPGQGPPESPRFSCELIVE